MRNCIVVAVAILVFVANIDTCEQDALRIVSQVAKTEATDAGTLSRSDV